MMSEPQKPNAARPSRAEAAAVYVIFVSIIARALTRPEIQPVMGWYVGLELVAVLLYSLVLWGPRLPMSLLHLYFVLQSALVFGLFFLAPAFDFAIILFIPLCYQMALLLSGAVRWLWIAAALALMGGTLFYFQGSKGFGLGLIPMAGAFLFAFHEILNRQFKADRIGSQEMLAELQSVNQNLQAYARQVQELTALEERNRLARELHDSVSQRLFAITLNTRAAQLFVERDPSRLRGQLEQLQFQTQAVLDEMRKLITELRPGRE